MPSLVTARPDNNYHPAPEPPDRQDTLFTVVEPLIQNIEREVVKDFGRIVEIQTSVAKRG